MNKKEVLELSEKLLFNLTDEETDNIINTLNTLTTDVEKIMKIEELKDIEPKSHPFDLYETNLREDDNFEEGTDINLLLRNAKKHENNEIEVPKVVG